MFNKSDKNHLGYCIHQMRHLLKIMILVFSLGVGSCNRPVPPEPLGPVPSERQLAWHDLEYYAFIHFNMNTFTDMEWGTGGESPEQFNPSELDVGQWTRVAKEAGMKGIIITAKHHDGFCLWPTKTTEHSVKNSPWRNGKGDLLKELSESCKANGLKLGLYLSPWDRNHTEYGRPGYVKVFHEQLRELLTGYGELFEVWFDGANGGSGYYGGANETRKIDNKTYYQWDKVEAMVRELQPQAVIFSDAGPDIRWVGNEEGWANETNWSIMRRDEIYPGWPRYVELRSGHEDGTHWLPAEADVSIRPGWYYHPREDHQVKSLPHLLDIYYSSVGRNAALLLNLPVDYRGLVHENDVAQLRALRQQLDADFATELAKGQHISATNERDAHPTFTAEMATDGDPQTYWATDEGVDRASLTLAFDAPTAINRVLLQEYIPLGQRVQHFILEAEVDGKWQELDGQTTIGYKRILRFDRVMATQLRLNIMKAKGPLALSNLEVYNAPTLLMAPAIKRNKAGLVTLTVPEKGVDLYYTVNGDMPNRESMRYQGPFSHETPVTLKAVGIDPHTGKQSETAVKFLDVPKTKWQILWTTSGNLAETHALIDEDPHTFWATDKEVNAPQEVIIDLGQSLDLTGFTYWPTQERYPFGIITHYTFSVSNNGKNWSKVAEGEFGNVVNNRVEQQVRFRQRAARYIKL